ncbi:MAG: aminoglycoside adenylyltransferase domain-containing protein [Candidatus Limnocylindrales bacterium]
MSDEPATTFARHLMAELGSALKRDLLAVYLYGSVVVGGFDEGVSDIDRLVVTRHDLDAPAIARIERFHGQTIEQFPEWNDRLELVYVARPTLAHFRDGGGLGVISPGEPFHIRDGIELWLQNLYLVRETGTALAGPDVRSAIPAISWPEFLGATRRYAEEVRTRNLRDAAPGARAYAVLTMCRALCTVRSSRPCSKRESATWVRDRMPGWAPLIDAAVRCRLSRGRVGFADDESRQAAETLVRALAAAVTE